MELPRGVHSHISRTRGKQSALAAKHVPSSAARWEVSEMGLVGTHAGWADRIGP